MFPALGTAKTALVQEQYFHYHEIIQNESTRETCVCSVVPKKKRKKEVVRALTSQKLVAAHLKAQILQKNKLTELAHD